ncbi:MAG: hypothetical protein ACEY3E_06830 [Candidatus Tisiphia sp.]
MFNSLLGYFLDSATYVGITALCSNYNCSTKAKPKNLLKLNKIL